MASGFFALLDDVAVLMDDVAAMSKIATKKTAGILADDLAVNAEKASGFVSSRELPVLWRIMKGSFLNKLIILPITFLLSAYLPSAIIPILIIGGVYLAYEGAEKIYVYFFHKKAIESVAQVKTLTKEELLSLESKKIKSAIVVDFILSIEIVIIALGSVIERPLNIQIAVVTVVAIIATIGVYGLVALLVRMDDLGYKLIALNDKKSSISKFIGTGLVKTLPLIIRALSVIGTLAMILVAGGIFSHNIPFFHHTLEPLPTILGDFIAGFLVGLVALFVFNVFLKIFKPENKELSSN
ncbi:MAG: putative DNA repair protein MutK [Chitinophagales bacterium]|jgi:predicted DNA repair protein MutK